MTAVMQPELFDRAWLLRAADWLAVATAASLPWSTSATSILVVLWLVVLVPAIDWRRMAREWWTAASVLPVALVVLGVAGMGWADVSFAERAKGVEPFVKLLLIPLLFLQFRGSERGWFVFYAYLGSCTVLLAASYVMCLLPGADPASVFFGVPVKNGATQSGEFVTCIFGLALPLKVALERKRWFQALLLLLLLLLFLGNIIFVATGRTAYAAALVLLVVFATAHLRPMSAVMLFVLAGLALSVAWFSSPYLRARTTQIWTDFTKYEASDERNSSGERIEFWKKSIEFMQGAPVIGHGTGTIPSLFAKSATGKTGATGVASTNPHNQTFAVGIQLGLVGVIVLWAMWVAHLLIFRGDRFADWIGLLIVLQNIIGSVFNSHLFDFNQGWAYVIGLGVAGGIAFKRRAEKADAAP